MISNSQLSLLSLIALSAFAAWVDMINILTLAGYELNQGPFVVGLVAIAMLLPHLLFSKLFVMVSRRFSFKSVMLVTLSGRAMCSLALVFVASVEVLIAILLLRGLLFGFMQPALAGYISQLPKVGNLSAKLNLIMSSSKIVAPAIGGVFAVSTGEQGAFLVSSVLSLCGLLLLPWLAPEPSTAERADPDNANLMPEQTLGRMMSVLFVLPVLFTDGLSNFFSNVIPHTFHEFGISKLTLSVALSASAIGNVLAGLALLKVKMPEKFSRLGVGGPWLANTLLFTLLFVFIEHGYFTSVVVPMIFFCISVAKTTFDVFLNGFIYNQPTTLATRLAALRQSAMAFAGISMTLLGSLIMETAGSMPVYYSALLTTGIVFVGWTVLGQVTLTRRTANAKAI